MKKNEDLTKLGFNIKVERMRRQISQEKFAELAGIANLQHISKIENGDVDMQTTTLFKVLRALNMKLEDLIDLDNK